MLILSDIISMWAGAIERRASDRMDNPIEDHVLEAFQVHLESWFKALIEDDVKALEALAYLQLKEIGSIYEPIAEDLTETLENFQVHQRSSIKTWLTFIARELAEEFVKDEELTWDIIGNLDKKFQVKLENKSKNLAEALTKDLDKDLKALQVKLEIKFNNEEITRDLPKNLADFQDKSETRFKAIAKIMSQTIATDLIEKLVETLAEFASGS